MGDKMTYSSKIFECETVEQAKEIILTPHNELSTEERWKQETPLIVHILRQQFKPSERLIDFGCGIGRIAKEMPNPILGIDISQTMRAMSIGYVNRNDFITANPVLLPTQNKFHGAYAIWSFQHVADPALESVRIWESLKEHARLVVIGTKRRFVPTDNGWENDDKDISIILRGSFDLIYEYPFAEEIVGKDCATVQIWRK